ncbi:efflux RND transporter periplasmic adaptor subunit [Nodosilinea sp. LEGE 07298]|uniref:efflux RND transporter periplasmic adaptor subunit n=1 Tax=Nodosilinea sp. LEGE 07298 TaxID=2777970 RepID=UPI00187EE21C|nr:efflux RND transporter periplasmic adaptor subunit [Nodosilinea sp. LEGE 07298]MBE9113003.1 efflux RND transporter periplasmic adaptor subunit [Nodosilinea sp. LEGE 07298]
MTDAPTSSHLMSTKPHSVEPATLPHHPVKRVRRWRLRIRRWWLVPLATVPLAVGVGLRQLSQPVDAIANAPPLPVETVALTPVEDYTVDRQYTGEIVAKRSSALGFEQGGTVVAVLVQEGDRVEAGQPLARLDTRSLEAQHQQIVAQRDQAVATLNELQNGPRQQSIAAAQAAVGDLEQQLALSQTQRDRRVDLYERGAISREELDQQTFGTGALDNRLAQAQSELDELLAGTRPEQIAAQVARVRQLEASLQTVDVDLSKAVMTAPFSGRISDRAVDEGVVVSGGQTVLQLSEGGATEARIGIPAEVADSLSIGSAQRVEVGDSQGERSAQRSFAATVTALLPELESTSRTVTVVLQLETPEDLTLGQTARLVLQDTQPTAGFWLPSTALVQGEQGLWSVYVADRSEDAAARVARQPVEIVHTEGDRVLVQGLVEPGDRVITAGTHRVVPGQVVSIPN